MVYLPTFTIKINHSCSWIYHTWMLWVWVCISYRPIVAYRALVFSVRHLPGPEVLAEETSLVARHCGYLACLCPTISGFLPACFTLFHCFILHTIKHIKHYGGGGFIFLWNVIFTPTWGNANRNWRVYFSDGLKPPPTNMKHLRKLTWVAGKKQKQLWMKMYLCISH